MKNKTKILKPTKLERKTWRCALILVNVCCQFHTLVFKTEMTGDDKIRNYKQI